MSLLGALYTKGEGGGGGGLQGALYHTSTERDKTP